jgi:hypothetical protein
VQLSKQLILGCFGMGVFACLPLGTTGRARYTGGGQTTASISNLKTTALRWNRQASLTQTPTTWAQYAGRQANGNPHLVGIGALPTIASCDRSAAAVWVVYEPETSDWAAT